MKSASPALRALIATGSFVHGDLWTITLNGGAVVRWSGEDVPITVNGNTFALGPVTARGSITEKIGLDVSTLTMSIDAGDDDLINGVPAIEFFAGRGLDGANVKLERFFRADWSSPVVGTIVRFAGKVTSVGPMQGSHAEITVSDWRILLNVQMPANLFQVPCLHAVYDVGCGLDPNNFSATSTVTGAPTLRSFSSPLAGAAGEFSQGRIRFETGPNAGITRTIKSNDDAGNFTLIPPLPALPVIGDAFVAYKGCDLSQATCGTRFNNLGRFKGTPYVPVPETALGAA